MTYLILLISNTFASILLTDVPFAKAELFSNNLVNDEQKDTIFTKQFKAVVPLAFKNGEIDQKIGTTGQQIMIC
jgi:YidC/Oxa1 family membrane protein insertase